MFLGLTFLQSLIVIFIAWDILLSVISLIKGEDYKGGFSIGFAILYGIGKLIESCF